MRDILVSTTIPFGLAISAAWTAFREIADALNERGVQMPRGGQWYAMTVRNVLARP